tara:strand:+ start:30327 stop:32195 length:1869 start_codon:yes stop_codon:yes gene_type:complete
MNQIVIGTAGHIDHGKTSLVKRLTGTDTDSLIEERDRGMTIDIGFARINNTITLIDVPGHEKFIRNMVAGVANIHFSLIVIAANDGVMPQTREHLSILSLLGIKNGFIALTKIDLVDDEEWVDLVETELKDLLNELFFDKIPIYRVNNLTGKGINKLKDDIIELAENYEASSNSQFFMLNVDRVFSKTGFGTVVTGTVKNGMISSGDEVEIFPNNVITKVRGLHTHGGSTDSVAEGYRAAINLQNIKKTILKRGSVLATPNCLKTTKKIIAKITILKSTNWIMKNKQRMRFHIGTDQLFGRVTLTKKKTYKKGDSFNVIINFENFTAVVLNDRFIVRSYSPMDTIAGGIVLNACPEEIPGNLIENSLNMPLDILLRFKYLVDLFWMFPKIISEWQSLFFKSEKQIIGWINNINLIVSPNDIVYSKINLNKSIDYIVDYFKSSYEQNPFKTNIAKKNILEKVKWSEKWFILVFQIMLEKRIINQSSGGVSLVNFEPSIDKKNLKDLKKFESIFIQSEMEPIKPKAVGIALGMSSKKISDFICFLSDKETILNIGDEFWISRFNFDKIVNKLEKFFKTKKELSIVDFKLLTNLSRKTAIPLLEFLDKKQITIRYKNIRIKGEKF